MSHDSAIAHSWQAALDAAIDRRFDDLSALRRRLHANPEPSGEELQTSLLLYQRLADEGFEVRLGPEGRGVLADFPKRDEDRSAPRVALRADIDALRINDAKSVSYKSGRGGVMHACGHDGHTALVLGAAVALAELRRKGLLPVPLRLRAVFQPAEETAEGAKAMIEAGALDGVSAIFATHLDPSRRLGRLGLRSGVLTANCDEMRITLRGRGGHAARPHETSDPIAATAQLINAIYMFIPRLTDSQDAVVVTFGQVLAGENANVIPESVELRGTLRTLDSEVRAKTMAHIRRLATGVGQTVGAQVEVQFREGTDSVRNDARLIEVLHVAGAEVVGADGLEMIPRPSMGSEDFAFYQSRIPGAMFRLGCTSERAGGAPLHSPVFDFDEEALRIGARVLARAAVHYVTNAAVPD